VAHLNCGAVMLQTLEHPNDQLLRELAPQVLGAVVRRFRDFAAAEDAVQDALIAASWRWYWRRCGVSNDSVENRVALLNPEWDVHVLQSSRCHAEKCSQKFSIIHMLALTFLS
jgi:hypothetical protein